MGNILIDGLEKSLLAVENKEPRYLCNWQRAVVGDSVHSLGLGVDTGGWWWWWSATGDEKRAVVTLGVAVVTIDTAGDDCPL